MDTPQTPDSGQEQTPKRSRPARPKWKFSGRRGRAPQPEPASDTSVLPPELQGSLERIAAERARRSGATPPQPAPEPAQATESPVAPAATAPATPEPVPVAESPVAPEPSVAPVVAAEPVMPMPPPPSDSAVDPVEIAEADAPATRQPVDTAPPEPERPRAVADDPADVVGDQAEPVADPWNEPGPSDAAILRPLTPAAPPPEPLPEEPELDWDMEPDDQPEPIGSAPADTPPAPADVDPQPPTPPTPRPADRAPIVASAEPIPEPEPVAQQPSMPEPPRLGSQIAAYVPQPTAAHLRHVTQKLLARAGATPETPISRSGATATVRPPVRAERPLPAAEAEVRDRLRRKHDELRASFADWTQRLS